MGVNKDQAEGLAKVADNLATATSVAIVVGGFVDNKIGWGAMLGFAAFSIVLLLVGFSLRKERGNGN